MAHTPDIPERFVCQNCQVIFAGTPDHGNDTTDFHPPASCSACGHAEFVSIEQYIHFHRNNDV